MAYADYAFYTTTYFGDTIPETAFQKYSDRATDELNVITLDRIGAVSNLTSATQTKVKKAMCALADVIYGMERQVQSANKADSGNVKSKSSGGESISYGSSETIITKAASDPTFKRRLYYDTVKTYLSGTGLLYAGV